MCHYIANSVGGDAYFKGYFVGREFVFESDFDNYTLITKRKLLTKD